MGLPADWRHGCLVAALAAGACGATPTGEATPFWRPWYDGGPVFPGQEPGDTPDDVEPPTSPAPVGAGPPRDAAPPPAMGIPPQTPPLPPPQTADARPAPRADAAPLPGDARPAVAVDAAAPRDAPAGNSPCTLTVTFTTRPIGGKYGPRNAGAVWIADANGRFVKSLKVWARITRKHLVGWNKATEAAGLPVNLVDAVSAPTSPAHETHTVTWACTDARRAVVPDGTYRVHLELAEAPGTNVFDSIELTKGPGAMDVRPPDHAHFAGKRLQWSP